MVLIETSLNAETYLPGETLLCKVSCKGIVETVAQKKLETSKSSTIPTQSKTIEMLEWIVIQVVGMYKIDSRFVKTPPKQKERKSIGSTLIKDATETMGIQ